MIFTYHVHNDKRYAVVWICGTRGIKHVTNDQILSTDIVTIINDIIKEIRRNPKKPTEKLRLPMSSTLMLGIVRIFSQKITLFQIKHCKFDDHFMESLFTLGKERNINLLTKAKVGASVEYELTPLDPADFDITELENADLQLRTNLEVSIKDIEEITLNEPVPMIKPSECSFFGDEEMFLSISEEEVPKGDESESLKRKTKECDFESIEVVKSKRSKTGIEAIGVDAIEADPVQPVENTRIKRKTEILQPSPEPKRSKREDNLPHEIQEVTMRRPSSAESIASEAKGTRTKKATVKNIFERLVVRDRKRRNKARLMERESCISDDASHSLSEVCSVCEPHEKLYFKGLKASIWEDMALIIERETSYRRTSVAPREKVATAAKKPDQIREATRDTEIRDKSIDLAPAPPQDEILPLRLSGDAAASPKWQSFTEVSLGSSFSARDMPIEIGDTLPKEIHNFPEIGESKIEEIAVEAPEIHPEPDFPKVALPTIRPKIDRSEPYRVERLKLLKAKLAHLFEQFPNEVINIYDLLPRNRTTRPDAAFAIFNLLVLSKRKYVILITDNVTLELTGIKEGTRKLKLR